eukprot:snap_masked-scaffold_9-processed-gene-13.49-mRNA-1 protein AED:1.00 eAED:1.00 QI:0/-1/0/0/-1/1/1/0/134
MPQEFNEVGIGENNISKKAELENLRSMISKKVSECSLTTEQKEAICRVISGYMSSWDIKQSQTQMSLMLPIEVSLIKGYHILRSTVTISQLTKIIFWSSNSRLFKLGELWKDPLTQTGYTQFFVVQKKAENPSD